MDGRGWIGRLGGRGRDGHLLLDYPWSRHWLLQEARVGGGDIMQGSYPNASLALSETDLGALQDLGFEPARGRRERRRAKHCTA